MTDEDRVLVQVDAAQVVTVCALIADLAHEKNRHRIDKLIGQLSKHSIGLFPLAENRLTVGEPPTHDPWSDDPDYPPSEWFKEIGDGNTRLGYGEWVDQQRGWEENY